MVNRTTVFFFLALILAGILIGSIINVNLEEFTDASKISTFKSDCSQVQHLLNNIRTSRVSKKTSEISTKTGKIIRDYTYFQDAHTTSTAKIGSAFKQLEHNKANDTPQRRRTSWNIVKEQQTFLQGLLKKNFAKSYDDAIRTALKEINQFLNKYCLEKDKKNPDVIMC